ncbi:MAG: metallophosphoesterase [Kiritimatiellae bacterium]|nr:metallophosphoesterase [Kiritimatiellia bacterium]
MTGEIRRAGTTRRTFVRSTVAWAITGSLAGCRSASDRSAYSVPLLGDVHYDRPPIDAFHSEFRLQHEADGMFASYRDEFDSFSSMWGTNGRSAALVAASGKVRRPDAAFALQLGDLIEGDCESSAAHARMLSDALALMKRTYGDIPFLTVAGNHDVRKGAHRQGEFENFRRDICAWHSRELARPIDDLTFSFWNGPDQWIIADYNRPNFKVVETLLSESRNARYTVFCTHGAVLTNVSRNPRCWFFLGRPQYSIATGRKLSKEELESEIPVWNDARRRVRKMLAERNAIVLSGHSHLLELRDWYGDGGRITEFVMNSVTRTVKMRDIPGTPVVIGDKPSDFGRCRVKPSAKPNAAVDSLYAEYERGMRRYYTADAAGHAELLFSDDGVRANYYGLDSTTPTASFAIRG